jgi:hypothetical protein
MKPRKFKKSRPSKKRSKSISPNLMDKIDRPSCSAKREIATFSRISELASYMEYSKKSMISIDKHSKSPTVIDVATELNFAYPRNAPS